MFKENFVKICAEKGVSPTAVCVSIGLSSSVFSQWSDSTVPRRTTLIKLSEALGVSVDYLLGGEKEKPSDEPRAEVVPFDMYEEQLLGDFRACDAEGRIDILSHARAVRAEREKRAPKGDLADV